MYLGQEVNMRHDMEKEISHRIRARWRAFNSVKDFLKARLDGPPVSDSSTVRSCSDAVRLRNVADDKGGRAAADNGAAGHGTTHAVDLPVRDHVRNKEVRERTGVKDVIAEYKENKFRCAGHVARFTDSRWARAVVECYP